MSDLGPLELDYLVETLRNPPAGTSVRNVLSYLYNYIPYVKHEHNLKVVISSFLNNPVCFGGTVPHFEDSYLIVEVIKLIFDKKIKVSRPTLPLQSFYEIVLRELKSFVAFDRMRNSWKVLPILTGMSLSTGLRDDLYPSSLPVFFSSFDACDRSADRLYRECLKQTCYFNHSQENIMNMALLTLALKLRPGEGLETYVTPAEYPQFLSRAIYLMYGPQGYCQQYRIFGDLGANEDDLNNVLLNPVMKHINKLSLLAEQLFAQLSHKPENYELISRSTETLLSFNLTLNKFVQSHVHLDRSADSNPELSKYWFYMKSILFSQVILSQGIISRFVESRNVGMIRQLFSPTTYTSLTEQRYTDICYKILQCLYYTNFVLVSIGQGGFDGYNFIYYVSLELCCKNNTMERFQMFSRYLIGNNEVNTHHSSLNRSYVARCKVLFVLGLFESYFQQNAFQDDRYEAFIYEIAFDLSENPFLFDTHVTEAGHSVLLAFFSKTKSGRAGIADVLRYFEVLVGQFPTKISATQLSTAVETLGKKIMSSPIVYENGYHKTLIEQFLHFIHFKCMNAPSGVSIAKAGNDMFSSALPIPNTDANSTVSQLPDTSNTNIVEENKHKKFKDMPVIDVVLFDSKNAQDHFTIRQAPETAKEGLILAFLNVVPYLPLNIFEEWLQKIWTLILSSNTSERQFLADKFWAILSENLDLNRCEVAYRWWYEQRKNVEQMNLEIAKL